jgi:hypothetical protein
MKGRLTYPEYLQSLAFFAVASKHYAKYREMELELCSLLGADDGYAECISDAIGSEPDFDKALAKQGIKVDAK